MSFSLRMNGCGPRDVVILLVLVLCCDRLLTSSAFYPKEVTVYIKNMLDKVADLNIHCKSKDDDLGIHMLQTTQEFNWHFHEISGDRQSFGVICHMRRTLAFMFKVIVTST